MELEESKSAKLPFSELTSIIIGCSLEVIKELGTGFLEAVYKNALVIALEQNEIMVSTEEPCDVYFRQQKVGIYKADIIVEKAVVIELKSCKALLPEHQAQVINYLKATNLPIGLLINFGNHKLEYKRLHHPSLYPTVTV